MPVVTCPDCGHEQIVRRELDGLLVPCEHCRAEFRAGEEDIPPRRSPRRRGRGTPVWVWFAVAGLAAAALAVAVLFVVPTGSPQSAVVGAIGPREGKEGMEWGAGELAQHFANHFGGVQEVIRHDDQGAMYVAFSRDELWNGPAVRIKKYPSRRAAQAAAAEQDATAVRTWGGFVLSSGNKEFLDKFVATLE